MPTTGLGDTMKQPDFRDGELLRCVGGPVDGRLYKVGVLFGYLPSTCLRVGDSWYRLDIEKRQWIYEEN